MEEDRIQKTSDANQEQKTEIPETEEELMNFLQRAHLENQPTEILHQIAERLKDRRTKLYPEEKMLQEEGGSSVGLGLEDEAAGLETDRKLDKSELNFDIGSEK